MLAPRGSRRSPPWLRSAPAPPAATRRTASAQPTNEQSPACHTASPAGIPPPSPVIVRRTRRFVMAADHAMSRTSHNNRPKVGNTLEMGFSPLTTSVRNSDHRSVGIPSAFPLPDARPHETGRNLRGRRGTVEAVDRSSVHGHAPWPRPSRLAAAAGSTIGAARVPRTRRPRQNGTPPPPPDRDPSDDRRGTLIAPQTARC